MHISVLVFYYYLEHCSMKEFPRAKGASGYHHDGMRTRRNEMKMNEEMKIRLAQHNTVIDEIGTDTGDEHRMRIGRERDHDSNGSSNE